MKKIDPSNEVKLRHFYMEYSQDALKRKFMKKKNRNRIGSIKIIAKSTLDALILANLNLHVIIEETLNLHFKKVFHLT